MPLWIVATPIGTLDDLSVRARQVLAEADIIFAEDTRTTRKLLSALSIPAPPLGALHAHNEEERASHVADRAATENVALVSDAGTPCVSDPGRLVVAACLAAGVEVRSVPGPSALASALAASGFPSAPSTFIGFAPRKRRKSWCEELLQRPETLVVYEAPTRLVSLLRSLAAVDGTREVVLCREISKRYEEVLRGPLEQVVDVLSQRERVRGECVLVIGPSEGTRPMRVEQTLDEGASLKQIAEVLAGRWGIKRRAAYQRLLAVEREFSEAEDEG